MICQHHVVHCHVCCLCILLQQECNACWPLQTCFTLPLLVIRSPLISTRSQRVYEFRQWCLVQFLDNSQVFPANQRLSDGCVHLPAQCVLQPGKDSLAGNAICNATTSAISILPEADLMTRVKDTDVWIPVRGQVLKMVDNGAGFSPDEAFFDTSGVQSWS